MFHIVGWALSTAASQARRLSVGWALPTAHQGDECAASRSTGLAPVAGTIDRLKRRRGADGFSAGLVPVESTIVPAHRTSAAVQSFARPGQARHGARHVRRATVSLPITARRGQAPDVAGRSRCREDGGQCPPYAEPRRGVILLVVMALLSLLTLMGLTLVLVTAQGRLSALAASRDIQPEQGDKELWSVTTQVVAGSTDPNSSFGAHGLLEDLYGLPAFFGQIAPQPAAPAPVLPLGGGQVGPGSAGTGLDTLASGQLLQLVVVAGNAYAKGFTGSSKAAPLQYNLPIASGSFCGQVITMLTGDAAGHSARVVGYFYDPNNGMLGTVPFATMQVSALNGLIPKPGDQFVINGRPFSGTGFGLSLIPFQTGIVATPWQAAYFASPTMGNVPLLNAIETAGATPSSAPYAYLPNHARIGLTGYAPMTPAGAYWDPAGPGGANEGYDAPDFQNLMLAMHYWNTSSGGGKAVTPIPSLHRPELVGWYYNQAVINMVVNPPLATQLSMGNPAMRRKVILRPEPTDHFYNDLNGNGAWDAREPFYDALGNYGTTPPNTLPAGATWLDLNGNGAWDSGDTDYSGNTFNPVTGCWYIAQNGSWQLDTAALGANGTQGGLDVDNDMDGVPDSIWVDAGLPVHKETDGTFTKNLAAILCIDLDGKLNLNAAGNLTQLDTNRYTTNSVNAPVFYDVTGTVTPKAQAYSGGIATVGSVSVYSNANYTQRLIPVSQGNGPPDANLMHLFLRAQGGSAVAAAAYYQIFLQGYGNPTAPTPVPQFVDGRYGESSRLTQAGNTYPGVFPPGSYTAGGMSPPFTLTHQLFNGPRPGYSQWYDPFLTSKLGFDWVNDAPLLARMSDYRPSLLTPWLQGTMPAGAVPAGTAPFFFDFILNAANHLPTAHGTPSDLLARGFVATDAAGHPYYAGTATFPWLTHTSTWQSTMYDYAVNMYFPNFPTPGSWPTPSQDVVLNEMVDTAYETNLTRQSPREGRNSGNNNYNSDFVSIESPLLPSEMESLLRFHEWNTGNAADSASLALRLNQLETAANYFRTGTATALTTTLASDATRLATTSESWDLPAPNVALTPQQMIDVVTYNNAVWAAFGTGTLNLNNLGIVDLARARIFRENAGNAAFSVPAAADLALFGNLKNIRQNVTVFPTMNAAANPLNPAFPVWPLLAPETVLGMRLDVNRLLGNGQDDNGNGVVDEPAEVLVPGEKLVYPGGQVNLPGTKSAPVNTTTGNNTVWEWLDLNNDGFLPPITGLTDPQTGNPYPLPALPTDLSLVPADMRARQLLARHLYVTMMLLLDDANISAKLFDTMGAYGTIPPFATATAPYPMLPAWPNYAALASSTPTQAAYAVAQWAINVVDFRDRDSISTPFEFDIQPFVANDTANPYVTWNVDDIVGPYAPVGNTISPDDLNPLGIRGLVWGCERPELLMTETVAFHDRGTDDTNQAEKLAAGNDTYTNDPNPNHDTDYDQVRRPRGSLIVELFNPTGYWDAPQLDMQYDGVLAAAGLPQPWKGPDGNGNTGVGVNLSQVAVTATPAAGAPIASPVWRLVISYSPWWNESTYYPQWTGSPAGTTKSIDLRVPTLPPTAIHRAVYFAPYQTNFVTAVPPPGVAFTSANGSWVAEIPCERSFFADPVAFPATGAKLLLPPGQYALVGPAVAPPTGGPESLYIGANSLTGGPAANLNAQRLDLGQTGASLAGWYTIAGGASVPNGLYAGIGTTMKPPIGVPIQTNWLSSTGAYVVHTPVPAGVQYTLRMSVSEPEHGYPVWPLGVASSLAQVWDDGFYYTTRGTPNSTGVPPIPNFPQHPFDSGQPNPSSTSYLFAGDAPNSYVAPNGTSNNPTTTLGYTVVYLQRLANPLAPWDLYANPYITVDNMPVDLTAYTGENQPSANALASATEPQTGYVNPVPGGNAVFDSRRRGYNASGALLTTAETVPDIWTPLPISQPNPYDGGTSNFGIAGGTLATPLPTATLGYLNNEYSASGYWSANPAAVAPAYPAPVGATGIPSAIYAGDPYKGFPWIAWNNRPFISPYELMLVPASSPSSLPYDFGMIGWTGLGAFNEFMMTSVTGDKHKKATTGVPNTKGTATTIVSAAGYLPVAQFGQLMNFFDSQQPGTSTGSYLPNLFRVFEYLQVPSHFAGTQDMMNPTFFAGDNGAVTSGGAMLGASHLFHTPFNWLSRYRDPGKINLNTVFDPIVFQGLMDDYPGTVYPNATTPSATSLWTQMLYSRQGFTLVGTPYNLAAPGDSVNPLNPPNPVAMYSNLGGANPMANYPTYFANPFRSDGAGALVPQTLATNPANSVLMQQWTYPSATTPFYYGANATMLRSQNPTVNQYSSTAPGTIALFDDTHFDTTNASATSPSGGNAYRNAAANDYFQYQMFTRLGNTTTNRSNVYAIWVTLGKFEVQPIGVNPNNPDGYRLLRPYADATGNQATTRGFYVFDRSIPMGFQRGQDLNIENGFLLERVLKQSD